VCAQPNFHGIPNIAPPGVVVVLLCQQRHTGHEGKCFRKILELKFSIKLVVGIRPHTGLK
jgi:hypothetical protein